jgi:hypothetical protein
MTIVDLLDSLPNGLHDAELRSIEVDYVARTANLDLDVWIGDMSREGPAREAYRHAKVTLKGLVYFVMEPPDSTYAFHEPEPLRIDVGVDKLTGASRGMLPEQLPDGVFRFWVYVTQWNSFIHVAATNAALEYS